MPGPRFPLAGDLSVQASNILGLSGTSGLASNPANREIASSFGASEYQDIFFAIFFQFFFLKKLEKI
jgi:hypothetical protein